MTNSRVPFPHSGRPGGVWFWLALAVAGMLVASLWYGVAHWRRAALPAAGVLRVGYAVEAPYAFVDATGRVTGEGPEVARAVAARIGGPDIVWRQTDFSLLIQELEERRIDVIAAGLFITPARAERVAFSRPTFRAGAALLVAAGNPMRLHSYDDAANRGARVAVVAGSVEEEALRRRQQGTGMSLLTVLSARLGAQAVADGKADAFALSSPALRWQLGRDGGGKTALAEPFEPLAEFRAGSPGGFAFRHDDRALRERWDAALDRYLGLPAHLELVGKFGFVAAEIPRDATTGVPQRVKP